MREPLNSFAARLVRSAEVEEFIEGLCNEHGVQPESICRIGESIISRRERETRGGRSLIPGRQHRPIGRDGFLRPLPGADPHDPDGGHDETECPNHGRLIR